jgi:hypothetical protein
MPKEAHEDEATYCLESLQTSYIVTEVHLGTAISDTPKNTGLDYSTPSIMSYEYVSVISKSHHVLKKQMKCDRTVFIHSSEA